MFGEALRLVRSFHQITQSDLSKALGISRSYLSEVESNRKSPSPVSYTHLDVYKRQCLG